MHFGNHHFWRLGRIARMARIGINMLTQEELKLLVNYDQETGLFTWKVKRQGKIKSNLGWITDKGYVEICIAGKRLKAHRWAWFYVYGELPKQIDHINCNKTDNRLCNLRIVTNKQNHENRGAQKNNTSGFKGVTHFENKWRSQIMHNRKNYYIGLFDTAKEAHIAYKKKANELFTHYQGQA
jgi:hypothetical protein